MLTARCLTDDGRSAQTRTDLDRPGQQAMCASGDDRRKIRAVEARMQNASTVQRQLEALARPYGAAVLSVYDGLAPALLSGALTIAANVSTDGHHPSGRGDCEHSVGKSVLCPAWGAAMTKWLDRVLEDAGGDSEVEEAGQSAPPASKQLMEELPAPPGGWMADPLRGVQASSCYGVAFLRTPFDIRRIQPEGGWRLVDDADEGASVYHRKIGWATKAQNIPQTSVCTVYAPLRHVHSFFFSTEPCALCMSCRLASEAPRAQLDLNIVERGRLQLHFFWLHSYAGTGAVRIECARSSSSSSSSSSSTAQQQRGPACSCGPPLTHNTRWSEPFSGPGNAVRFDLNASDTGDSNGATAGKAPPCVIRLTTLSPRVKLLSMIVHQMQLEEESPSTVVNAFIE